MEDLVARAGQLSLAFLVTVNLMALFMLLNEARTYLRDRNRREEADARYRIATGAIYKPNTGTAL